MLATPVRTAVSVATLPLRVLRSLLPAADIAPTVPPTKASSAPTAGARVGKYDVALLTLAEERPGITVAVAAGEIGVPASGLYPTIRRLENQGRLEKRGRGLHTT